MRVRLCDRCRKELDCIDYSIKEIGIIYTYTDKEHPWQSNDKRKGKRLDLCDECQNQLERWWNNEESM